MASNQQIVSKQKKNTSSQKKKSSDKAQAQSRYSKAHEKALKCFDPLLKIAMLQAIYEAKIIKAGAALSSIRIKDPFLQSVQITRKDIPYWNARFGKGTQVPTMRLYFSPTTVATNGGGTIDAVYPLIASSFINYGDLANVFDEYRVIKGEMTYTCSQIPAGTLTNFLAVGVIDYGDATALGSYATAASYDTKKRFNLLAEVAQAKSASISWPVHFERLPDQEWNPCSSSSVAFAWLKLVTFAATGLASENTGVIDGWMEVQFRGSD